MLLAMLVVAESLRVEQYVRFVTNPDLNSATSAGRTGGASANSTAHNLTDAGSALDLFSLVEVTRSSLGVAFLPASRPWGKRSAIVSRPAASNGPRSQPRMSDRWKQNRFNFPAALRAAKNSDDAPQATPMPFNRLPLVTHASRSRVPMMEGTGDLMMFGQNETPVQKLGKSLFRTAWLSWWVQLILSTVSGVLLLFVDSVSKPSSTFAVGSRIFALVGLFCAIPSTLWTWRYRRLASKLGRELDTMPADAAAQAANLARFGTKLNMAGMLFAIIGSEAIVGTLASKALTASQAQVLGAAVANTIQPIDMLLVQANTNLILSHFLSLVACMRVRGCAKVCEECQTQ